MEHLVQFAVSIDDDAIKNSVAKNVERVVIENMRKDIERIIFDKNPWGQKTGVNAWAEKMFSQFLDEHKSEIIEEASKMLADRLSRTKAVKEMVQAEIRKVEG